MPNIIHCAPGFINADHVVRINGVANGKACLTLADGEEVTCIGNAFDMATNMSTVVPDSGSGIVLLVVIDDLPRIIRWPVIAWRISLMGTALSITIVSIDLNDDDECALLLPNGEVRGINYHDVYDNEASYLAAVVERQQAEQRERLAAMAEAPNDESEAAAT